MMSPVVVVITGLPGTGKSMLAELVARRLGAPAFAGDWLLGSLQPAARVLIHLSRDEQFDLYNCMLRSLVHRQLLLGQSAVADCLVPDEVLRDWTELAGSLDARLVVVECVCTDIDVHRSRVEGRLRDIPGWHEVDWAHVERIRAELAPLTIDRLVIDAVNPIDTNLETVLAAI